MTGKQQLESMVGKEKAARYIKMTKAFMAADRKENVVAKAK